MKLAGNIPLLIDEACEIIVIEFAVLITFNLILPKTVMNWILNQLFHPLSKYHLPD